ncbi:unnamed protein product [Leptosia nina]|uniref:Proline-rich protein PRCC n=1 Tax=Leptosia nina TaxID=320188 RepID=A0AAV1J7B9_9NEOP
MALVAYENSDSSDDETETTVTLHPKIIDPLQEPNHKNQNKCNDEQNLFNLLPLPSKQKIVINEDDDEFLHKKEKITKVNAEIKPKSRITVPSLDDFKDVKGTLTNVKSKAPAEKKSGLLSILPQPKHNQNNSTKKLIPQSVINKPAAAVKKKDLYSPTIKQTKKEIKSLITDYSDDSDDEIQNDFFSINKPIELPPDDTNSDINITNTEISKKEPRTLESYFKKDEPVVIEKDQSMDLQFVESNTNSERSIQIEENILDEEAILKLCGTRGKRKREEIQIVDINQQDVLKGAREMLLKGLMDDTTKRQSHSKKKGNEPTSQQKRKHQITYLAHQAKANEAELQNQWANNRMTKRQTQSKYGF